MSIFDDSNKVKGNWFKTDVVGNKLEGTLVGKSVRPNRLKKGEDQNVYEILTAEGEIWNVGGKPGIDAQMKHIKIGQIVGFEFVREEPAKVAGYDPTKIVQVYANPKIVNEKWLKEREAEESRTSGEMPEPSFSTPEATATPKPAVEVPMPLEDMIKEINNLAIQKLGANTPEEVKEKVMEHTGIAFIQANVPHILEALKQLP